MEKSTQKIREHIVGQIPDTINHFLDTVDSRAIRIFGDTPNSVLDPTDYLESIRPFVSKIEESIRERHPDAQMCFVAVNIFTDKDSYFVLDLNNTNYVWETAHTDTTPIPVYVLRLSKRKISIFRQKQQDESLATRLAMMHNGHGSDPLPLVDDFNHPVMHRTPRWPDET